MVSLVESDQKKLVPQLERTVASIEQLLLAGLTTASQSTLQTLAVTFQEASRLKLLRLGATLRATCDEINRYIKDEPGFSSSRLMFFLNRSWLICKGLQRALTLGDAVALENLLWNAPTTSVDQVEVVCLGVSKKIAAGSFCAFEFRLREIQSGKPLIWSTVFPLRNGTEIPAEGYLHLPHKQKFTASVFLERKIITIQQLLLSQPQYGPARIQLTDTSQVAAGSDYSDWAQWFEWDLRSSLGRIKEHVVSPFDVDVELQEEIAIQSYTLGETDSTTDERKVYHAITQGLELDVIVSRSIEGQAVDAVLQGLLKPKSSAAPMFGLLHYAQSRMVLQPLSLLIDGMISYSTISDKAVDRKALLAALKFT